MCQVGILQILIIVFPANLDHGVRESDSSDSLKTRTTSTHIMPDSPIEPPVEIRDRIDKFRYFIERTNYGDNIDSFMFAHSNTTSYTCAYSASTINTLITSCLCHVCVLYYRRWVCPCPRRYWRFSRRSTSSPSMPSRSLCVALQSKQQLKLVMTEWYHQTQSFLT